MASNYNDLLRMPEWKHKRDEIKRRDNYTCQSCGLDLASHPMLTESDFDVHHLYYQKGRMPWEYPSAHLITLCAKCHRVRHQLDQEIRILVGTLSLRQLYILFDRLRAEHRNISPSEFWKEQDTGKDMCSMQDLLEMGKARDEMVSSGITGRRS